MATYKGRDVQILRDPTPMDNQGINHQKVVILTEDGEKTVGKGEVIIYSDDEVPVYKPTKEDKALSESELRTHYFKKATPKQIEQNNRRKEDKQAKDQRMTTYAKQGLTPDEITEQERLFYIDRDQKEATKANQLQMNTTFTNKSVPANVPTVGHPVPAATDNQSYRVL